MIWKWIIAAIAVERITEIISTSKIFEPIRNILAELAYPPNIKSQPTWVFIHSMISCGLCLSVWVAGGAVCYLVLALPDGDNSLSDLGSSSGIVIKWACLFGMANTFHMLYSLVYRGRVLTIDVAATIKEPPEESNDGPDERMGAARGGLGEG